jgi:hypothetical protein
MADLPFGQKETFPISWRLRAERAEGEVRALTARLDAATAAATMWQEQAYKAEEQFLELAIRAATADPTPQTDDDT